MNSHRTSKAMICDVVFSRLKTNRGQHHPERLHDVIRHELLHVLAEMFLRILPADVFHHELLRRQLVLLHDGLFVLGRQLLELEHDVFVLLLLLVELVHLQTRAPLRLVQIQQHLFFQHRFGVRNADAVVVPIQPVDQRADRRFVQVPQIRRRLSRLLTEHDRLRINQSKRIDHHLPSHALHRVDDHGDEPRVQLLERLLRVDVHPRQPAPEPRVRVVPTHHHLLSPGLLQHV